MKKQGTKAIVLLNTVSPDESRYSFASVNESTVNMMLPLITPGEMNKWNVIEKKKPFFKPKYTWCYMQNDRFVIPIQNGEKSSKKGT